MDREFTTRILTSAPFLERAALAAQFRILRWLQQCAASAARLSYDEPSLLR
jgi:hypothetical protein